MPLRARASAVRPRAGIAQADRVATLRPQSEPQAPTQKNQKDSDTLALERTLSDTLGLDVSINHKASGGQIRISYKSLEQLEEVCRLLERR